MSFVLTFERQKSKSKHIDIKEQNNLYLNTLKWEKKTFLYSFKILFYCGKIFSHQIFNCTTHIVDYSHNGPLGLIHLALVEICCWLVASHFLFPQPLVTTTPFTDTMNFTTFELILKISTKIEIKKI